MMSLLTWIFSVSTSKAILVGLAVVLIVYWSIQRRRYKLPPGPFALPLIGNMLQFKSPDYHKDIFEWSKTYGPVLTIYLGPLRTIIVNDLKSANEVLIKRGADFADRYESHCIDVMTSGGKDIVFGQYDAKWRLLRKISSKALRRYMQGDELERRVHTAVDMITDILKKEVEPVDPKWHIHSMVFSILYALCFGKSCEFDDPEIQRTIRIMDQLSKLFKFTGRLEDIIPPLRKCPMGDYKKYLLYIEEWFQNFIGREFSSHFETYDPEHIRDFTDMLIEARKAAEEEEDGAVLEYLTDDHLIQTLNDIFFAGVDTTKSTLRWSLLYMAAYPGIQEKVQKEVDGAVGRDRLPGLADRPNLGYTDAVLHECMRLASFVPLGLAHRAACDTKIGEYDVPKGTTVMVNLWALHHDPDRWENVDMFKPERYLTENGEFGPTPESWLPFSAGRRVCLGESVAKPELHLIFASLMQRFTVGLPEGINADFTSLNGIQITVPKDQNFIIRYRE